MQTGFLTAACATLNLILFLASVSASLVCNRAAAVSDAEMH